MLPFFDNVPFARLYIAVAFLSGFVLLRVALSCTALRCVALCCVTLRYLTLLFIPLLRFPLFHFIPLFYPGPYKRAREDYR